MSVPLHRLRLGLATLGAIFVVAVAGYCVAGWDVVDAIYMTVITLSTVGFREVAPLGWELKLFTSLIIVFGVSVAVYIGGGFVQMVAEGEIAKAMGVRRATREIERLTNHIIICGFGRMGEVLAGELHRIGTKFVVVEGESERIAHATSLGYLALLGDATEEDALLEAHVGDAKTVVTTLPSDADNVFITLTSRNLKPDLQIIARGEFPSTEKKLIQAGADRVVLPAATGAMRMAALITRPSIVELIEVVAGRTISEVETDELTIPSGSPLVGVSVRDSETRSRHGLLIVAIGRPDGAFQFNPDADTIFEAGHRIIVMGRSENLRSFCGEYGI